MELSLALAPVVDVTVEVCSAEKEARPPKEGVPTPESVALVSEVGLIEDEATEEGLNEGDGEPHCSVELRAAVRDISPVSEAARETVPVGLKEGLPDMLCVPETHAEKLREGKGLRE